MGGSGWRKAFCTSSFTTENFKPQQQSPSSYSRVNNFFSATNTTLSNPATPRSSEIKNEAVISGPALRCRTTTSTSTGKSPMSSPRTTVRQNHQLPPSSPRSPSRFSLLKNSIRLSKSRCGVCLQITMAVHGTAIFIAECSHSFHFACIAAHVQANNTLACPVCAAMWRHVPSLAVLERPAEGIRCVGGKTVVKQERVPVGKGYSDDEPLCSPGGSVTCFNPILEVEGEDEDGEEEQSSSDNNEFQGFFATTNPQSSTTLRGELNRRRQRDDGGVVSTVGLDISVESEIALLSNGRNHDKYVVPVKVKAFSAPAESSGNGFARAPIDLVVVVDVSGVEMNEVKLQMLKRCIRQVIASLTSSDRLSLVVFASTAKRLVPLQRMTPQNQRSTRRIVDRIVSGNSAHGRIVGDALRKATRILEDRRDRNPVASIMFLSDGQKQPSPLEKRERIPPSSSLSCRSSSTTSSAGTRFAHIEIPLFSSKDDKITEQPEEAFARCVGRFHSVVVKDVVFQLKISAGEITAMYSISNQAKASSLGTDSVNFGDLYADEERNFLIEIRIPSSISQFSLVGNFNYKDPLNEEAVRYTDRSLSLTIPPLVTPRNHRQKRKLLSAKAETVRNLFVTTRAVTEARRLTGLNDTGTALHLLSSARALLLQSTEPSAVGNLRTVETELAELQLRRQRRNRSERDRETSVTPTVAIGGVENAVGGIGAEALTPTSAWRAAERLAKLAVMKKSLNRVSDLHGFEDARF
ncbi:Zinc finger (C3HC4-type RING finger) family protein [Zostera marina]|uniref:Zinc finger (C3HC4-type RING finger) family protein n=1 Tax=Zostera marina TaxID=29655 RepID=A0A0K9NZT5_ZOSMR|nr:Zinc finger (C3HC4-type RING finger) family protein [Zostera marina]